MELFSRRRWRLVSAQVVSCCIYENTKQKRQCIKGKNQICCTIGQIRASVYLGKAHPRQVYFPLQCTFAQFLDVILPQKPLWVGARLSFHFRSEMLENLSSQLGPGLRQRRHHLRQHLPLWGVCLQEWRTQFCSWRTLHGPQETTLAAKKK